MGTSCTYFQSDRWKTRLKEVITRVWDTETLLKRYEEIDDTVRGLDQLQAEYGVSSEQFGIDELVKAEANIFDVTIDEIVELWEATRDREYPETCPHDVYGDGTYCVFHLFPDERTTNGVTEQEVAAAFIENVRGDKRAKQFVGATFENLDLDYETLAATDRFPIDLRLAKVTETLTLENSEITQDLLLHGAELTDVSFKNAEFNGYVGCHDTAFIEDVDFSYIEFAQKVEFWAARFDGDVSFYTTEFDDYAEFRRTTFSGKTDFRYTNFGRDAEFWDARFDKHVTFHAAEFDGYAEFRRTTFSGEVDFKYANFTRDAEFWEATFRSEVTFYATEFGGYAEFKDATFQTESNFRYAEFDRDAEFWYTTFKDRVNFRNTVFNASAEFEHTEFESGADFRQAEFYTVRFDETKTGSSQVDLIEAEIQSGMITGPKDELTFYNLRGATLGRVDLASNNNEYHLFEFFRFYDTQFKGFDFPRHREALNPTWQIHQYGGEIKNPDTAAELESTYLKAKNGASQAGDNGAAAEFFLREMKYRRRGYWETVRDRDAALSERLPAVGRWMTNWFYNLTCGYGERPLRTISFSLGLIVVFAFAYQLLGIQTGNPNFLSYLTFSFQTFVTLILGNVPRVESVIIRLFAAFEAFLGAFFIALFVFALARSIRR